MSLHLFSRDSGRASSPLGVGNISTVGVAALCLSLVAGAVVSNQLQRSAPLATAALVGLYLLLSIKVVRQWEKVALLRFGCYRGLRGPGVFAIIPIVETLSVFVDQRVRVTDVSAESIRWGTCSRAGRRRVRTPTKPPCCSTTDVVRAMRDGSSRRLKRLAILFRSLTRRRLSQAAKPRLDGIIHLMVGS